MKVVLDDRGNIISRTTDDDGPGVVLPPQLTPHPLRTDWNGTEFAAYTPDQVTAKAFACRDDAAWDNTTMSWVDTRSLGDAKTRKNAEINAARLAANRGSFSFAGKTFACDELSRSDIDGVNGLVALTGDLPPGWPGAWKAVDNTYVHIPNVQVWTEFYGAMVAQGNTNFAHAQSRKAALEAADTLAEVDAIVW